ncbi:MAG: hypothetical protein K6T26_04155 [Alicyclobacillus sp.]|nr:hypothetical protein [Alicyclobacillus sp.]
MRKSWRTVRRQRLRALLYTAALLVMSFYALPYLPSLHAGGWASVFTVLWLAYTGVALAANLYFLLGADRERSRMLEENEILQPVPAPREEHRPRRAYS